MRPRVDVGIITIREDEFRAVLDALPDAIDTVRGRRIYELRWLEHGDGRRNVVAIVRAAEQGNTAAQAVANDLLSELEPRWVLVVGIAGGRPSDEFSLGDVVVSNRIVDHSVGAALPGGASELAHGGGPVSPEAARIVANLPARDRELGAWGETIQCPRPSQDGRAPRFVTGAILSSDLLMRDPERLRAWLGSARQVLACEMESAGAYRVTHDRGVPFLAIRGISDVVGVPRDHAWTAYAAASAAAFARAFLRTVLPQADGRESATNTSATPAPPTASYRPIPAYEDESMRRLAEQLERGLQRRASLRLANADTREVDEELLQLKRHLREGGQLRAGDALGDGRYLLLECVGRGGFAMVWRALDRTDERQVAIKVLHANLAGDPARRSRFFRGARMMAALDHPAVVNVIDPQGEDGGWFYFVMEFVSGGDLRRAVLEKSMGQHYVEPVIRSVGSALAKAHEKGIVHRDVKPANILIDQTGMLKLTDFDLVAVDDTTGGTGTGAMGTFIYSASEMMDRPQSADARADVFSLGMTILFCLHGAELPHSVIRDSVQFIDGLRCGKMTRSALKRAVAWSPDDRFENANQFCHVLLFALNEDHAAVATPSVPSVQRNGRRTRRSGPPAPPRRSGPPAPPRRSVPPALPRRSVPPTRASDPDPDIPPPAHVDAERARGSRDPYIGTTFDHRYKIEKLLGEGGMGYVYLARHKVIDKKVAVKVLRAEMARDREILERFLQEARAASSIGNPHIIDISDFGQLPDGSTYFVMEFLDGKSLSQLYEKMNSKRLGADLVVRIAIQMANGLAAAHERGIIHRDLKPENIFIIQRGADKEFVKILDFGIAKVATSGENKLTLAGAIFGTPHYMSPEQAAGAPLDHRTDIYSLGVMLYEMVSGQLPFVADNFMGILSQHMYQAATPLSKLGLEPPCPPELEAIIFKCLSKTTEDRYPNMEALATDLLRFENGQLPEAVAEMATHPDGTVLHVNRKSNRDVDKPRNKVIRFVAFGATVMGAALGTMFILLGGPPPKTEPDMATSQAATAPPALTAAAKKVVRVVVDPRDANASTIYAGKQLTFPASFEVEPGTPVTLEVKAKGYEPQTVTLDGSQNLQTIKLWANVPTATTTAD